MLAKGLGSSGIVAGLALLASGCGSGNGDALFLESDGSADWDASGGAGGGSAPDGAAGSGGAARDDAGSSTGGAGAGGGGDAGDAGPAGSGGSGGEEPTCGNGTIDPGEQCDGENLAGHGCNTALSPIASGTLGCAADCSFDTSGCCVPQCAGKSCGADGCGGVCGSCAASQECVDGSCKCVPSCSGKQCGSNGCGGSCGSCPSGTACSSGQCVCAKQCSGKTCGSDGCGGSCGTCSASQYCYSESVCVECNPECHPVTPATSGSNQNCFAWPQQQACKFCNSTCGLSGNLYTCAGSEPSPLVGCKQIAVAGTDTTYCCPGAACVRYTNGDTWCSQHGKPGTAYACAPGKPPPSGCVKETYAGNEWWCCP